MKKFFIMIIALIMIFSVAEGKILQDFPAIGDGVAVDADLLRIEDMSASVGSRTKKILLSSLITYIYGDNRTMSGTLAMGGYEISGSNIDFTGGILNGVNMGGTNAMTYLKLDEIVMNGNAINTFQNNEDLVLSANGTGVLDFTNSDMNAAAITTTDEIVGGSLEIKGSSTLGGLNYIACSSATPDVYEITLDPALSGYEAGMIVVFNPDSLNTGASTIEINSLAVKTIKYDNSGSLEDLEAGMLDPDMFYILVYDGTYFQVTNPTK